MAQDKTKLIAIDNGCYVAEIKKVNDNELNIAKNVRNKKDQKQQEEIANLYSEINVLRQAIKLLQNEIKILKGEE